MVDKTIKGHTVALIFFQIIENNNKGDNSSEEN